MTRFFRLKMPTFYVQWQKEQYTCPHGNHFSHSVDALATQMTSALYPTDMPVCSYDNATNQDGIDRQVHVKLGEYIPLFERINPDQFDQSELLITEIPPDIRLLMSRSELYFGVWNADNTKQFKAFIRNSRLAIHRYIPSPDYLLAVSQQLQTRSVKYHLERMVMRVTDIPRSIQRTIITELYHKQLSKIMFIGYINSEDFHEKSAKNSFLLQNLKI